MPWRDDPATVRPMLASPVDVPLLQRGWVYEPKYDGIRAVVDLRAGRVRIYSRNGNDKTAQFPAVAAALDAIARKARTPLVADGEIVAVDAAGRPLGFQHIQGRIHLTTDAEIAHADATHPAAIVLFDLLRDGHDDLRGLSLAERRLRLQARVKPGARLAPLVRLSEIALDDGRALMARARRERWEGLIAKDGQSRYLSGKRAPSWRKLKLQNAEEFIVGGWTEPRESRQHFGALLVGYHEGRALRFAGSVGTGFDERELARLAALFARRARATSPFAGPVKTAEPAHWITPDLVAEVRFTEWTSDGLLRHPVYLGQRDDKGADEVEGRKGSKNSRGSTGSRRLEGKR